MHIPVQGSSEGLYFGEIRVFKQYDTLTNYGQWLRFQSIQAIPDGFSALHQEIFASGTIIYKDKDDNGNQQVQLSMDDIGWI
jgi:hypothetical protein